MTTPTVVDPRRHHAMRCAEVRGGNHAVHAPVELPGIRGVIYSRPCGGGRGGDLHYLSVCGSGLLSRICIADVVGHGESVAAVGKATHDLVRRLVNWPDQRRMLRLLNRSLLARGLKSFTTAAAVTYYPPRRSLSFSYAGHPPAWFLPRIEGAWRRLVHPTDTVEPPETELVDCALAIAPTVKFRRTRLTITPGDRLLLITDGVLETPDSARRHFGDGGVAEVLDGCRDADLDSTAEALLGALAGHGGSDRLDHDDVTFILLEFTEPPAGPTLWHVIRNRLASMRSHAKELSLEIEGASA